MFETNVQPKSCMCINQRQLFSKTISERKKPKRTGIKETTLVHVFMRSEDKMRKRFDKEKHTPTNKVFANATLCRRTCGHQK